MKQTTILRFLLILAILPMTAAIVQTPDYQDLGARLQQLEERFNIAQDRSGLLSHQVDSLAAVIGQQKREKGANLLRERALADGLKFSQAIAKQLQTAKQVEAAALDSLLRFADSTFKFLNGERSRLTTELQTAKKSGDDSRQKDLAAALRAADLLRRRCERWRQYAPANVLLTRVEFDPSESRESLTQKADFLRDQADRLRRSATQTENKLAELRQETRMRERMSDFVQDLRVFDPTSETATSGQPGPFNKSASPGTDVSSPETNTRASALYSATNFAVATFGSEAAWPTDIGQLSTAELQKWISQLDKARQHWQSQADSLDARAREIDNLIHSRRNNPR